MKRPSRRKRKPIKPMTYPHGHEASYRRSLLTLSRELKLSLKRNMSPLVPQMVKEVTDHLVHPMGMMVRHDAWADDMKRIFERITKDMIEPQNNAVKDALVTGAKVNRFNKDQWIKLIRSQYGVDPTKEDPQRFDRLLSVWTKNNALLIQDIPRKTMNQIRDATIETLQSGRSVSDMTKDIYDIMSERTDVTDSRARLIARDQVAKLNGNLTQERQKDIGVEGYIWRTVGDERVRETHEEVDGKFFSWDNPPDDTDGNHPGEDYQCRCWAEPVLPEEMAFNASLLDADELEDA